MDGPLTVKPKPPKDSPNQMWVEGPGDLHVIASLQERRNVDWGVRIVVHEGISDLFKVIESQIKPGSTTKRLGIVFDADDQAESRWSQITEALMQAGYQGIPHSHEPNGTIIEAPDEGLPRIGVWLMPDNENDGMLEDFVISLVPVDSLWQRAVETVDNIPDEDRRFADRHLSKARVHTWIAWQADPGLSMGLTLAHKESKLLVSGPLANRFVDWLGRLYG